MTAAWDCVEHGHLEEHGSYHCVVCGENLQMTFEEVVEYEPIPGDPDYTLWLEKARPQIDTAVAVTKWRDPQAVIEDVLPGL